MINEVTKLVYLDYKCILHVIISDRLLRPDPRRCKCFTDVISLGYIMILEVLL